MKKKVRVGLVGCGRRGVYLASLFQKHPDCELTTLMDRHRTCAEQAAATLKQPDLRVFDDFDQMLHDAAVDALLITSDPTMQVAIACQAMERGRHVCTEVPAAFTIDECWQLVETVQRTGCKYQLMEQTRYWGFVDAWRHMHQRGELGHICMAQGEYVHYESNWNMWYDPRTGEQFGTISRPADRDVLPTWRQRVFAHPIYYLPHTLSPLLKILDDRVERVTCMATDLPSHTYPAEKAPLRDIEYATMHTTKDTLLLVGAGFSLPHVPRGPLHAHWYELRGTRGSVTSPRYPEDSFRLWRAGGATYEPMDLSTVPLDADADKARTGHGGADFKPIDTFISAIVSDTTPLMDVYLTAEMTAPAILAAESSARNGMVLYVPDFRKPRDQQSAAALTAEHASVRGA